LVVEEVVMNFDVVGFLMAGAENAPIVVLVVIALTYLAGKFGLAGKAQLALAFCVGVLFGGGLQVAGQGMPGTFGEWFWMIVYAIVLSMIPSLLYDQAKELLEKAIKSWVIPG